MKQVILTNWSFPRFLRLILGFVILTEAIISRDLTIGFAGLFFTLMPIFNIGCCGSGSCCTQPENNIASENEISYEEVV